MRSPRLVGVAVLGALAALLFVVVVPAGQPYDEPAHWGNVQYYEEQGRMPELGDSGVGYEAQMGPVYYALAAGVAWPVDRAFGQEASFYAVRSIGALLAAAAVVLTYLLGLAVFPARRSAALLAAAFVGLSPALLTVGGSIQNDYLAMVLAVAAALCVCRVLESQSGSARSWLVIGALIGLATLTKVFAIGLLPAVAVPAVFYRDRRMAYTRGAVLATLAFLVVSGWWFIRNVALYGDISGRSGLDRAGFKFPALHYSGVGSIGSWIRSLISYLWVPTEYYRHVFSAPGVLRAAAVGLTAVLAALVVRGATRGRKAAAWFHQRADVAFLVGWCTVTFLSYAVVTWTWTGLAPRIALVAVPGAAVLVSASIDRALPARYAKTAVAVVVFGTVAVAAVFLLYKVNRIPTQPYWIRFS